jgi:hypothetical protein
MKAKGGRRVMAEMDDVRRDTIMKVVAQEVVALAVAFTLSLAISVAVVELIRGLILSEQQIAIEEMEKQ